MDNRGIDTDPGWMNRKFRDLERKIEDLRSERRSAAITIPSGGKLTVSSGGTVVVDLGGSLELNLPTTSATANVTVDAVTGVLARSTSSARYEQDIADINLDLAAILKMRPRTWRDRRDVAEDADTAPRYVGFVAEELHDAGLGAFVGYDTEGEPESVAYDRLTVALLILAKFQQTRLGALAARATALETTVADLTVRMSVLEPPAATTPLTQ